jgi:Uma2 family endonuclease
MSPVTAAALKPFDPVEYPDSDGKPMAETPVHLTEMINTLETLQDWFRDDPNVYLGANMFLYYQEGDPRKAVSPDVFVTKGIPKLPPRRVYKTWVEGRPPDLVLEVTSASTSDEDLKLKRELYETLGVDEYFLFDPLEEYLEPSFQGLRLERGRYAPIALEADGTLYSRALGLKLRREGTQLRLIDPATGETLLRVEEARARARADREASRRERKARREAEAAHRQAEAARREAETAHRQAEAARREEEIARREAEAVAARERAAREEAKAELARLRAKFEALSNP